jgi:hypothetical protein
MSGAPLRSGLSDKQRLTTMGQRVARELALDCALADVVNALDARGVSALLLKGPALSRWLYEDQSARKYGDIDLLVDPVHFDQAESCLRELGFTSFDSGLQPHDRHHEVWTGPGPYPALLELHRTLYLLSVSPERVWKHMRSEAQTLKIAGAEVLSPGFPALALIVALHAAQHGRDAALPLEDLKRAVAIGDVAVWTQAVALARELECLPAFAAGLKLIPEGGELAHRLGIAAEGDTRSLRLMAATPPPTAIGIEALFTTSGLAPRMRLLKGELMPSAGFMRGTYPLARRGRAGLLGAYLLRPLSLAVKLPRGLVAWLRAAIVLRRRR